MNNPNDYLAIIRSTVPFYEDFLIDIHSELKQSEKHQIDEKYIDIVILGLF